MRSLIETAAVTLVLIYMFSPHSWDTKWPWLMWLLVLPRGYVLAIWSEPRVAWQLAALGGSFNCLVCACNHWLMPALSAHPLLDGRHVQLSSQSHLVFLADIIGRQGLACSVGDLLILIGFLVWLVTIGSRLFAGSNKRKCTNERAHTREFA